MSRWRDNVKRDLDREADSGREWQEVEKIEINGDDSSRG